MNGTPKRTDTPGATEPDLAIMVPDHPDLDGVIGQALEFGAVLRHANTPAEVNGEPWQLPDALVDPQLEVALDTIAATFPYRDVGDDQVRSQVVLHHQGVEHMGVYIAHATRGQLDRLAHAAAVFDQAAATPRAHRLPAMREVGEFAETMREIDEVDAGRGSDVSFGAWRTIVRILTLAIAEHSTRAHRPTHLLDTTGASVPTPAADIAPAADTITLVHHITDQLGIPGADRNASQDAGQDVEPGVELDAATFNALRRLQVEWHTAIFNSNSSTPNSLLTSYIY